jgi:rhamnosyltransferase
MEGSGGASVIIRVRNEQRSLERCLSVLAGQRDVRGGVEVIVVDSGSDDASAAVARRAGARLVPMPASAFTFGGALNLGAAQASHEVIVSLSAHAFPADDGWLARVVAAVDGAPDVACACGDRYGPDGARLDAPRAQDAVLALRQPEWGYSNAAGAFRGSLWRRRPFRADLPACEDKEWALHWLDQGYRCVMDPSLVVDHDHTHDSPRAIYRRARREALGYAGFLPADRGPGSGGAGGLAREWWSDTRWYDSAVRARLSHRRAARLLGSYAGRRAAGVGAGSRVPHRRPPGT